MEMAKRLKKKPVKTVSRKIDNQAGQGLSNFLRAAATVGSWSTSPSKDPAVVAKVFKTKVAAINEIVRLRTAFDDLARTHQKELEKREERHAQAIKDVNHEHLKADLCDLAVINTRLLDILEAGSKGESFPRRA